MITKALSSFWGSGEELFGRRVTVPDYPELDDAMNQAVKANKAILPDWADLSKEVNTLNAAEIERLLKQDISNLDELDENISRNIASWTRGEIGSDVENLISRKAAEQAVAGGFSGSGMHRNLVGRDLGLTSLQMIREGIGAADRWIASVRNRKPMMDVTSMFVTPAQQFAANEAKWNADLYRETMAAAPDPVKRGFMDNDMEILGMVLSAYSGGSGYKNPYKQPTYGGPGGGGGSPWGGFSDAGMTAGGFEGGGAAGGWGYGGGGGFSGGEGATAFV